MPNQCLIVDLYHHQPPPRANKQKQAHHHDQGSVLLSLLANSICTYKNKNKYICV
jgi:hypothetical protein